MAATRNPGRFKPPPTGKMPAKGKRQHAAVYESARTRGATKESAAKQAWGVVKRTYKKVDDEWVHRNLATSENKSIATHYVQKARKQARWVSPIRGGVADGRHPREFNEADLIDGTLHELEHTDRAPVAMKIAMDHMAEDRRYYKKLARVESSRNAGRKTKMRKVARHMLKRGMTVATPSYILEDGERRSMKSIWPDAPRYLLVKFWDWEGGESKLSDIYGRGYMDSNVLDYPPFFMVVDKGAGRSAKRFTKVKGKRNAKTMTTESARAALVDFAQKSRYTSQAAAVVRAATNETLTAYEMLPGYPDAAHNVLVRAGEKPSTITTRTLHALYS